MDVRNYNLPVRKEAYDFPPEISPVTQGELAHDNPGALWIIATEILTEDVCYDDLPETDAKCHGVKPVGQPFKYHRMNNVSRIPVTRTPAETTCFSLSCSIPAGDPHGV